MKVIDLTGQMYGRLTVIARAEDYARPSGRRSARWICQCTCGRRKTALSSHLRQGATQSCGCLQRERSSAASTRPTVTYGGAHRRVEAARGLAAAQACVDCLGPAGEWSYRGDDPNELKGADGCAYSLSPSYYDPRCCTCHRRHDAASRNTTQSPAA